jgi:hypothetical protein
MDRNVSVTIIVLAVLVSAFFWWGWRKVVGAPSPPSPMLGEPQRSPAIPAAPPALGDGGPPGEPRYADKPAILSEAAPTIPAITDNQFWLWDGALLATRSLDDLVALSAGR